MRWGGFLTGLMMAENPVAVITNSAGVEPWMRYG
jgi:hypothetical protein